MADQNQTTGAQGTQDDNVPVIDLSGSVDAPAGALGGMVIGGAAGGAAAGAITSAFPTDLSLEEQALMEETTAAPKAAGPKYVIPAIVKDKFPDLIKLINETESMNEEERDYWFQILPIMSEQQIAKFRQILLNEKEQLAKLDEEYNDEIQRLNNKHMLEWKEFESKEKRAALTAAEKKEEVTEKVEEAELLKRLSSL
jgi:hypothetical protein